MRAGFKRNSTPLWRLGLYALLVLGTFGGSAWTDQPTSTLEVATFVANITPPVAKPIGLEYIPDPETVEHPLMAKGVVLRDTGGTYVLCTLDWMEVHNESYDLLREAIAGAAEIPVQQVALHCVHQHTAPAISTAAQRWQFGPNDPRRIASLQYVQEVADKLAQAVRDCRHDWKKITHLGTSKAQVDRVAANRRIELSDGTILGRASSTRDKPELREHPEGLIDPWLRTVSFYRDGTLIVQLHYFATHPQSFYNDKRISYDIPGMVREPLERETGATQIYFTGCGGDVAMGKYNDGSPGARDELAARLSDAMRRNLAQVELQPVEPMRWKVLPVRFPTRHDEQFTEEASRRVLADPKSDVRARVKAAVNVAWIERTAAGQAVELSCLSIASVRILHLPGEPFVQFQLAAQRMRSDGFVCVAGFGDCGMGYIGGDRIYTDRGGYEQTSAFSGPCEQMLLGAMNELLADEPK